MAAPQSKRLALTVLCGALLRWGAVSAQTATAEAPAAEPPSSVKDQVVVTGQAVNQLRVRIRRDEDAVYTRFNEINSNDKFDIHCDLRAEIGSHIQQRVCVSNAWKEDDTNYAAAQLQQQRGEHGPPPEQFRAKQYAEQSLLDQEFRRLAAEDPVLHESLVRLGQAYIALDVLQGGRSDHTLHHEVPAGDARIPSEARHMLDVRIGPVPWTYQLTERAFTIAGVSGRIRGMRADCAHGGASLKFQADAEWTLPSAWGECHLTVYAKHDTTFAFFEFDAAAPAAAAR
jgi:hypothetical protein